MASEIKKKHLAGQIEPSSRPKQVCILFRQANAYIFIVFWWEMYGGTEVQNTTANQKTWTQIRKHERKSENINAISFWFAFMFFDLHLCFLICIRVFWFAFLFFDLRSCFLICVHVSWFAFVFFDLHSCFLICVCVFWFAFVFSDLRLCFLICRYVFWFTVVFSDLPLCFAVQSHRQKWDSTWTENR